MTRFSARTCLWMICVLVLPHPGAAQLEGPLQAGLEVTALFAEPERLHLRVGESATFRVWGVDGNGEPVAAIIQASAPRDALEISPEGVTGRAVGEHRITASVTLPPGSDREPVTLEIPVVVEWPSVAEVEVVGECAGLLPGERIELSAVARHLDGTERPRAGFAWTAFDDSIASVDSTGVVSAHGRGVVTIHAEKDGVRGSVTCEVDRGP